MTAIEVLRTMLLKYSIMKSYQDSGVVLHQRPDRPEPNQVIFSTSFLRPDRFRFEWTTHHPYPPLRHLKTERVIWSDGGGAFLYDNHDGGSVEQQEDLIMAIAGATGVSMGSALTVSNMLLPEIGAVSPIDFADKELREDVFEGIRSHCIRAQDHQGDYHELVIGMDDYVLRSVKSFYPEGVVSQEIRRNIQIDSPIDEITFRFDPSLQIRP
jgi:hypothetical protein